MEEACTYVLAGAQSGVLRADSSKAITERERSEDRDHRDMAVQDAVPRFE